LLQAAVISGDLLQKAAIPISLGQFRRDKADAIDHRSGLETNADFAQRAEIAVDIIGCQRLDRLANRASPIDTPSHKLRRRTRPD
jgi:hypothetical protein